MNAPTNSVWNCYQSKITNLATTRSFGIMSDKFDIDKICSPDFVISSSKKENNNGYNIVDDDNSNSNDNVTWLSDDRWGLGW
jgi:hypothetical protein